MADVVVVGARCAGAPLAMLLARAGHEVVLVDRASFPSDTLSTHFLHQLGCMHLARWGLLDRLEAEGAPLLARSEVDMFGMRIAFSFEPAEGVAVVSAPRRWALDDLLVRAAREAGADVRERTSVERVLFEGGRPTGIVVRDTDGGREEIRARVVVGADGRRSTVAREVGAPVLRHEPAMACAHYSYFRGIPTDRSQLAFAEGGAIGVFPTNGGLVCVFASAPVRDWDSYRADVPGMFSKLVGRVPRIAEQLEAAERVERWSAVAGVENTLRQASGPGWALVGDAGYEKDPVTGEGITDAFRDAELLARLLAPALAGSDEAVDAALAEFAARRDEIAVPLIETVITLADPDVDPALVPDALMRNAALRGPHATFGEMELVPS